MRSKFGLILLLNALFNSMFSQGSEAKVIRTYDLPQVRQGVTVDSLYFYVINNSSITKHHKTGGQMVLSWEDKDSLILHMNSGSIIQDKLYVVNSNYPEYPMASSLEIFDPHTLQHIGNHSFGIVNGSATWMDRYNDHWYVAFAHYTGRGSEPGKDNSWSRLVKFDLKWRQIESWVFPGDLLDRFESRSNSGGVILSDGKILCTGHDNYEVYVLEFPEKGYTLNWTGTLTVGSFGQGIDFDIEGGSEYLYGIIKKKNRVVVTQTNFYINPQNFQFQ